MPKLDHVYLDANALLYPISENTKNPTEIGNEVLSVADGYATLCKNPNSSVSIFFDGPPPMGKIRQQRMRRFQYEPTVVLTTTTAEVGQREGTVEITRDGDNLLEWSPAMFSTGTIMMEKIGQTISNGIPNASRSQPLQPSQSLHPSVAAYSSSNEPGEGEHKIIRDIRAKYARNRGTVNVGIVGKDADLLLLAMGTVELMGNVNIYILRHDDQQLANGYLVSHPMYFINTGTLRQSIIAGMTNGSFVPSIWDFIIATPLFGNDFLPPIPSVDNIYEILPIVM